MDYPEGTILQIKNIKFKGTERLDFRLNGHPVILPIFTNHSNDIYFFTSSSKTGHYATDKDRYFLTGNLPKCGLPLPCIIDLKHAYKIENKNFTPKSPIPISELRKMITKAVNYKDKSLDNDYVELLKLIK